MDIEAKRTELDPLKYTVALVKVTPMAEHRPEREIGVNGLGIGPIVEVYGQFLLAPEAMLERRRRLEEEFLDAQHDVVVFQPRSSTSPTHMRVDSAWVDEEGVLKHDTVILLEAVPGHLVRANPKKRSKV